MPSASNEPTTTDACNRAMFGSSGTGSKLTQSFSKMGLFRPSRFNLAASSRKAAMAGRFTPSLTVTNCVSQLISKSCVGSISAMFKSSYTASGLTSSFGRIFGATLSNVARVTTTRMSCPAPHLT